MRNRIPLLLPIAFEALTAHRTRSALTTLGVAVGVAALVFVSAVVEGANDYIERKLITIAGNVVRISKAPLVVTSLAERVRSAKNPNLTIQDLAALRSRCRFCEEVGGVAGKFSDVRSSTQTVSDVLVYGHTASMETIDTRTISSGRYFTEEEAMHSRLVCMLGASLARRLAGRRNPIGSTVRIHGDRFTVIGVFEPIGSVMGQDRDAFAVIPLQAFLKSFGSRRSLSLHASARPGAVELHELADGVRAEFRRIRGLKPNQSDDFHVTTAGSYESHFGSISDMFSTGLFVLSAISTFIGGIVVMNIALVSVNERRSEIALRRACGATRRDISVQFLLESLTQCLAGGALGAVAACGAAAMVSAFTVFPTSASATVVAGGLALSSAVGLASGTAPALHAARVEPAEGMREMRA